jgi:hypothetical protein
MTRMMRSWTDQGRRKRRRWRSHAASRNRVASLEERRLYISREMEMAEGWYVWPIHNLELRDNRNTALEANDDD